MSNSIFQSSSSLLSPTRINNNNNNNSSNQSSSSTINSNESKRSIRPRSMYQFQRQLSLLDKDHPKPNGSITSNRTLNGSNENLNDHDGDLELKKQQSIIKKLKSTSITDSNAYSKGKTGFDWLWRKSGILGNWMNKQAGKMGMEAFWPTSLDLECDKCARILYTFTRPGMDPKNLLLNSNPNDPNGDRKTQDVIKTIPPEVIQNAKGLAIFTVFRTGLGWSASSGSGVVIARDSPTSWGPPSGILIHTIGVGFLAGIDVYDAVLVLRTEEAVMSFGKPKVSLGAELSVVAGPIGNGASLESGIELSPVFAYIKSKGIYGGLQLDGTIIIERSDENARFYSRKIKAEQILNGGAVVVPRPAFGLITLIEAAEGKPVDFEEFPENIDIAPSDQSDGVSNVNESRQKAKEEYGVEIPEGEERRVPERKSSQLPEAERLAKRRTLPPLPYRAPSLSLDISRQIPIGSRISIAVERSERDTNFKPSTSPPRPSSPHAPSLVTSSSATTITQQPIKPVKPPPPPPRSLARGTSFHPRQSPQPSKENLNPSGGGGGGGEVKALGRQSTNLKDQSSGLKNDDDDEIVNEDDGLDLSGSSSHHHHLQRSNEKSPPEPFQLHSRVTSQSSISIDHESVL